MSELINLIILKIIYSIESILIFNLNESLEKLFVRGHFLTEVFEVSQSSFASCDKIINLRRRSAQSILRKTSF